MRYIISTMNNKYNMAWRLDGRSHPAVALPNDFALHYSLSVRGPVATVCLAGVEGGEEKRGLVLVN